MRQHFQQKTSFFVWAASATHSGRREYQEVSKEVISPVFDWKGLGEAPNQICPGLASTEFVKGPQLPHNATIQF